MTVDRSALVQTLRAFCARHPSWALFDEPTGDLLEIASGKRLQIRLSELVAVEERPNSQSGVPYLMLGFGDGHEIAIADIGIAFAAVTPAVPHAPTLPPVVCMQDFLAAYAQLRHHVVDHPDEKPDRSVLDLMVLALGILEGARVAGFDISREERELDAVLSELEKRR
ncbi:MAG TPA: hypothetical protein VGK67_29070 [Myxococcales bacterium]|jgi:hypothetical protein